MLYFNKKYYFILKIKLNNDIVKQIITKGDKAMKNFIILLFIIVSFSCAENIQNRDSSKNVEELKLEKQALELKLESYKLKKKLIEMEKFFEKERLEKEERLEREKALLKLKHDLRTKRKRVAYIPREG